MRVFERKTPRHFLFVCILWILTFAWFAVCFGLSSQTGEKTGELSRSIASFVASIFRLPDASIQALNKGLRISAHVFCFFVLSLLMGCACAVTSPSAKCSFLWPLLPCALFAFADEMRKAGIPGRHCSFPEAWLNVAGCALGIALLWILRKKKYSK